MMRVPWVEALVVSNSIIIICLLTVCCPSSSTHHIRCSSCLYPDGFDLDSRPFRRRRLAYNVFACVYLCARARFLLCVDSVLSISYRVNGSGTCTRCCHCRFFLFFLFTRCVAYPKTPAECFLSLVRACFILSLKSKIYSMCIIWCLNEIRLSYIYIYIYA